MVFVDSGQDVIEAWRGVVAVVEAGHRRVVLGAQPRRKRPGGVERGAGGEASLGGRQVGRERLGDLITTGEHLGDQRLVGEEVEDFRVPSSAQTS